MKLKYSPIRWNENAGIQGLPDTEIVPVDVNSIRIDGKLYEFDPLDVEWSDITKQTDGNILEANRVDGELRLVVRRFYTRFCQQWDTGEYHEIIW